MLNNSIKDFGIILKVTNLGEKDKLVYVFLQKYGLIKAFAFGAQKSKKRFGGNLEPYNLLFLDIIQKKEIHYLCEVRICKLFLELRKNLLAIEILQNLSLILTKLPLHENKKVFKLFYFLLTKLNSAHRESMIRGYYFFLLYLLKIEGIFPHKTHCFQCENSDAIFVLVDKNEPQFLCHNCLKKLHNSVLITNKEVTKFIDYAIKSPGKLFNAPFQQETYNVLNNIIEILFKTNFHLSFPKPL